MTTLPGKPPSALWVIALAISCGLALSQLASESRPPAAQNAALEWLATSRPVAPFTLTSAEGIVTAHTIRGHWQLLVLGFMHCPDLCPTTLSQLAELRSILAEDDVGVILVSVDPQRDSPAQLAAYVAFFGEGFIGLTGSEQQLHRLANSLGLDFRHDGPSDNPRISHSPTIALIGPNGFLRGRLRPGFDIPAAARELTKHMRDAS